MKRAFQCTLKTKDHSLKGEMSSQMVNTNRKGRKCNLPYLFVCRQTELTHAPDANFSLDETNYDQSNGQSLPNLYKIEK